MATVRLDGRNVPMLMGSLQVLPLEEGEWRELEITPARNANAGAGRGKPHTVKVRGGVAGLILDGRGRPLSLPSDTGTRVGKLRQWLGAFGLPVE
jgi:hypothetical protein